MSSAPLVSDLIAAIRNKLKPAVHDGVYLPPEQVAALISNLNTVHAVAIELEDDKAILEREARLRSRQSVPIAVPTGAGNVVHLPVRCRLSVVGGADGGDAA
jgi:hypothetical protein